MWRQREGKSPACLQRSNQATGPIAAQIKRDGGNDCIVWLSLSKCCILKYAVLWRRRWPRPVRIFFFFFFYVLQWENKITQQDNWSLHFQMLMKYACVHCRDRIHAEWRSHCDLMQSTPPVSTAWGRQCVLNCFPATPGTTSCIRWNREDLTTTTPWGCSGLKMGGMDVTASVSARGVWSKKRRLSEELYKRCCWAMALTALKSEALQDAHRGLLCPLVLTNKHAQLCV